LALWKLFCSFQVPCGRVLGVHRDGSVNSVFVSSKFRAEERNSTRRTDDQGRTDAINGLALQGIAAGWRARTQRGAHLSTFWYFSQDVLQMETAPRRSRRRRPLRSAADSASVATRHRAGGGQQDSLPASALSLRSAHDRRLPKALSPGVDRAVLRSSPAREARDEPVASQPEAPTPPDTLDALRKATAGSPVCSWT
jgi:hypothetical protein